MITLLLTAALAALPTHPPGVTAGGTVARPAPPVGVASPDPVRLLRSWTARARNARDGLDEEDRAKVRSLLSQLRTFRRAAPERGEEIDVALLDLAALRWLPTSRKSDEGIAATNRLAKFADWEFDIRRRQDPEAFDTWLADSIVAVETHSDERRTVAAVLLRGQYRPSTRAALMRTARTANGELRVEALAALIGWPDIVVHQFFLDSLEDDGRGIQSLAAHLEIVRDSLQPAILDRLRDIVGRLYLSDDWRDASRARIPVRALDTRRAAPVLIEALALWTRRAAEGKSSKRTVSEIVRELQRISGRSIEAVPERWNNWWSAVLEGRVALPETVEDAGGFVTSATSFFGLNVTSDRVVFVIDRSGSMDATFGTDGRTRYEEAIRQFQRFVEQAGPELRFGLVLFSDDGDRWNSGLVPATTGNIESAQRWLFQHPPSGATHLFEGISSALRLDRRGHLVPERQEADTVIVLCDGATELGPSWVAPWIRAENQVAQLVFHSVQIGRTGNGTLEALAARSGGDFIRVDS